MVAAIDILYNVLAIPFMRVVQASASLVSDKWRARTRGEESSMAEVQRLPSKQPRVWFHAASMGEFEQLVPIMTRLRNKRPEVSIIATVFSPSGYDHACKTPVVDHAFYLPLDSKKRMSQFVGAIKPSAVVVDRYDLWRNLTKALHNNGTHLLLVNATEPTAARRSLLRAWTADTYRRCTVISAVTEADKNALRLLTGRDDIEHYNDTRMDRILDRMQQPDPSILTYRRPEQRTVILGSTWPKDDELMLGAMKQLNSDLLRCIIVPHEPTEEAIQRIKRLIPCTRWSESTPDTQGHLVVDQMGLLLSLYLVGDAAFVGGGFGAGVHSLAEPAGCGLTGRMWSTHRTFKRRRGPSPSRSVIHHRVNPRCC